MTTAAITRSQVVNGIQRAEQVKAGQDSVRKSIEALSDRVTHAADAISEHRRVNHFAERVGALYSPDDRKK